jgi:hypothetical protein
MTLDDYHPPMNPGSTGYDGQRYPKATHNPDGTRHTTPGPVAPYVMADPSTWASDTPLVSRTYSLKNGKKMKSFGKAEFATAAGNKFKIPLPGDTRNIQEERPENRPGRVRPPVEKKPVMKTNRPFGFSAGPGPDAMTEDDYRRAKSKRK